MQELNPANFYGRYLDDTKKVFDLVKEDFSTQLGKIIDLFSEARSKRATIFIMGNGGSAMNASHFAEDLSKGTISSDLPRFKAVSLTESVATILAWANDSNYEDIFLEQLKNLMEPGDVVVGLSGSGNSMNVLKAIEYANSKGNATVGFTGYDGGKLKKCVKISFHAPICNMQIAEDIHMQIAHVIMGYFNEQAKI